MTKNVKITVKGVQRDDAGEAGSSETFASGEYYCKNGSRYIFYEETADFGECIQNSLKLKENVLELNRKGAVNSRMIFEAGKSHVTDYATPFGVLRMEVVTSSVLCLEEERNLEIRAEYELWADSVKVLSCRLTVEIESA